MGMKAVAKQASKLQVFSEGLEVYNLTVDNSKPCFHCAKKGHTPESPVLILLSQLA